MSEETKITFQDISFGKLLVSSISTDATKVVTKETLSIAMQKQTVKTSIFMDGIFLKAVEIKTTTTVKELRTTLSLN